MQSILDHIYLTLDVCMHCASEEGFHEALEFADIFDNYPNIIATMSAWGRIGSPLQAADNQPQYEGFDIGRNEGKREITLNFLAMAKIGKMARAEFIEYARAEHKIVI